MRLYGRSSELARIRGLLASGGALVLRGEAGIGKSALLDAVAVEGRVLRGAGIASEADLPYAALYLLFRRHPELLDATLRDAFDLGRGSSARVGSAVLGLLEALAPVACLVDDAHRLDPASVGALAYAARRLGPPGVAIVLATRDHHPDPLAGLPELRLPRLDRTAAEHLLTTHPADRDRLLEWAEGNPLALLAGADGAGEFRERIVELPAPARVLLAAAAADGTGDLHVLADAARRLEVPITALDDLTDLLTVTPSEVRFTHPLTRIAAYDTAPLAVRLAVHRALAATYGRQADLEREATHLAAATLGTDEPTAAELEHLGTRAANRGRHPTAATAYAHAADLSAEPADAARRLVAAGEAALAACRWDQSEQAARRAPALDATVSDRTTLIRASVEAERGSPRTAGRLLLAEADTTEALGEAAFHAWSGGDQAAIREAAARLAERDPTHAYAATARAMVALLDLDLATGIRLLRETLAVRDPGRPVRLRILLAGFALLIGQDQTAADLSLGLAIDCGLRGLTHQLPHTLQLQGMARLALGACDDAKDLLEEGLRIARETGQDHRAACLGAVHAWLAAVGGCEERCRALAAACPPAHENAAAWAWAAAALSLLDIAHGRYAEAESRLAELHAGPASRTMAAVFAWPDHVEAAVRAGAAERAREPLARWEEFAEHSGSPWARAVAARCRALTSEGDEAGELYAEAIALHAAGGRPFERARTELLYGEWLRRRRRRTEARGQLRAALSQFETIMAAPWAARARTELRATGESREQGDCQADRLTVQELQVARLAAAGASNKEIAAQLFLSHRTVGYHLYKAFPKLGIASRAELSRVDLGEPPVC